MDLYRLIHSIRLASKGTGFKRADYVKRHNIFYHVGENCMFMFRKIPLHAKLISVGNNVHFASNVSLITHDVTHNMFNAKNGNKDLEEYVGCIKIGDNVFVGANTSILYDSEIPSDTIIGSDSLVNRKIKDSGVYAGCPVRYICSIEEFLSKRDNYRIVVKKEKGRLSKGTVEECWNRFYEEL